MSRRGNFEHNYPKVIKWLKDNDVPYHEFADGQHLRIMGPTRLVDVWPSRMTYHIVDDEDAVPSKLDGYRRLNFWFDEVEFEKLINGGE